MLKISPSLLSCDFSEMGAELSAIEAAGADMAHLDIMDGHFVPNITFGPPVVAALRRRAGIVFDTHLMISRPLDYVGAFADAGAGIITFHAESECDPLECIRAIKKRGLAAGISVKPKTPAETVRALLPELDMALVMTVEPGFGGQSFMPETLEKIAQIRRWANDVNPGLDIQVDGGIDNITAPLVVQAGANVLVAGSYVFKSRDYKAAIDSLRNSEN
jgi:ribulose-phosphate 3-epimerase